MPDAEKFTALGAGNGFNSCLSKRNVLSSPNQEEEYFKWTTLSGFNKDSEGMPTPESINESYVKAMAMFWNIYSLKGSADSVNVGDDDTIYSASVTDTETDIKPDEQACNDVNDYEEYDSDEDDFFIYTAEALMGWRLKPVKLYKGVTTDEANFIGYGLLDDVDIYGRSFRSIAGQINFPIVFVALSSLQFQDTDNSTDFDSAYVVVDGFHFVSFVGQPTDPDASSMSASVVYDGGISYSASITGFEFYTYPA